jgi:Radial spokehead-like protein
MQSYEAAQGYLKQADAKGQGLYDHLTHVLAKIIKEKPENPLEVCD